MLPIASASTGSPNLPDNQTCYCIHIRVTLGDGRDDQPPPTHMWSGSVIADMLQEAFPSDHITKAVVLALGEAILFFGRHSCKEGLLYRNSKEVDLSFRGPVNWARRTVQVEVTVNTMQEGPPSYCRCCHGKGNKGQEAWAPPRVKESHLVLSCHL